MSKTRSAAPEEAQQTFLMMDLLRAFYWFDESLQAGLKSHGWEDVTRSQSLILANIAFGVRRASQLARNLGVTRQAVSQMLIDMEKKGLVVVKADPTDGRAQIVNFSPASRRLREDAMNILAAIEGQLGERLGKRQLDTLSKVLRADWGAPTFADKDSALA